MGHKLSQEAYPLTTLRTDIIIRSGSASFETIRDLVEKLSFAGTPKWLKKKFQPTGIDNFLDCLIKTIGNRKTYKLDFNIVASEVMTYEELFLRFVKVRNLKRFMLTVLLMKQKLFSYWLYFITSTSLKSVSYTHLTLPTKRIV